jgi:FtsP/CotA-like multicopper oxidase with cupredoxin domain
MAAGMLARPKAALRTGKRPFLAAIPGGTLDPGDIEKYAMRLVVPPAMPKSPGSNRNRDLYRIAVRQFEQQILPAGMPRTTVWSYGSVDRPATFNYPAFTIEATYGRTVQVQWRNELVDAKGNFLPHLLPIDPTLHWANPPGGTTGRDSRPAFTETPGPYTGPVPMVTHVHGAHTYEQSDGYAEAWYLPDAKDIPGGYATTGTLYDYFNRKYRENWSPGTASFRYPNDQRAATLWYHDHTLGMTRANVYAGPAGFYLLRGGPDDLPLGYTAPGEGADPFGEYTEIPLAIQDRSFNLDGSLFYPDSREFFDGILPPYAPETDIPPIWNPEFFGNTMVVNGRTWPYLDVTKRRYRFRVLNGCNSRFLILDFSGIPGAEVWQIGAEGGFLAAPVDLTTSNGGRVLLAPAERADLVVDFTGVPAGSYELRNLGPDEPFGGGEPNEDFDAADPDSTGKVMEFRVAAGVVPDPTTHPRDLALPAIQQLPAGSTRRLALIEEMSMYADGPVAAMLGTYDRATTRPTAYMWDDPITENPGLRSVETWEFYNFTADAHPVHIHEVQFQVVNRQALAPLTDGEADPEEGASPVGEAEPPESWETGWKDTVIAYPGAVTRVKMKFDLPGLYVWHCHIVEHEDNEMMRPLHVGPIPPDLPIG